MHTPVHGKLTSLIWVANTCLHNWKIQHHKYNMRSATIKLLWWFVGYQSIPMDLSCLFIPAALVYSVLFIDCISHCMEPIRMKFNNSISCRMKQYTQTLFPFAFWDLKNCLFFLFHGWMEPEIWSWLVYSTVNQCVWRQNLVCKDKILHGKYFSFFKMKSNHALHFLKILRLTSTSL